VDRLTPKVLLSTKNIADILLEIAEDVARKFDLKIALASGEDLRAWTLENYYVAIKYEIRKFTFRFTLFDDL